MVAAKIRRLTITNAECSQRVMPTCHSIEFDTAWTSVKQVKRRHRATLIQLRNDVDVVDDHSLRL